jgi:sulfur relay (sulfurtransferase) DsrF/TusC family protein
MGHIAMILRKPPYGDINAAEAVRHALGAVSSDWKVSLIMVDGGVLLAKKGQDDTGTGFTNLESTLKDCVDMGIDVYADDVSLVEQSVKKDDLTDGIQVKDESEIALLLKSADKTMIF